MKCDVCGGERRVGDWPFCKGDPKDHVPGKYGFDPFQGYVDEHILEGGRDIGPNLAGEIVQGTRIDSRSERKAIMKREGIEFAGRKYGRSRPMF